MSRKEKIERIILSLFIFLIFSFTPSPGPASLKTNGNYMEDISSISFPPVFNLTSEDKEWVAATLAKMTLREKCAQMVMPWLLGEYMPNDSIEYERITRLVKEEKVGGIIFFRGNIVNEALLINEMQKISDIPLLVASDFERGLAMRITDAIEFPYNMAVAAAGNPHLAFLMGRDIALESRALGVTQNYAPVADINNNPENPIINIRAFSEDKNIVSEFCDQFIKGAAEERIITTAKHFPGHGDTQIDSHQDMPVIKGDSTELFNNELVPFISAIKSGVQCIMVGHLDVPAFDSAANTPATLSKPIITGVLKEKLGFKGLIATDAMNMSAVTKYYSAGEAAVKAVEAGNDLILMPPDEEVAIDAIYNAAASGKLNTKRIDESVVKILSAKRWLRLNDDRFADIPGLNKRINNKSHIRLSEEIAEKSITLVKNNKMIVPVDPRKIHSAACITISDGMVTESDQLFQNLAGETFYKMRKVILNGKSTPREYARAYQIARQSNLILLPSFVKVKAYQGTVKLSKKNTDFIKKVLRLRNPSVLISFGNPYLLSLFPGAKSYLCAYGDPPVSQRAMLKAITGQTDIQGRLPVSIPGTNFKIGDGIKVERNILEFTKAVEDTNYDFSNIDSLIESAIGGKIFPGAVLLIGKDGKIIFNKPFGRYTFESTSHGMTGDAMFDLSTLTQAVGTSAAAMILYDEKKLDLNKPAAFYLPEFGNNGKDSITIKNLLVNNSGIGPHTDMAAGFNNEDDFLSALMKIKPDYPANKAAVFSDLNSIILQKVIEKISGRRLDEFLKEKLFKPLKLSRAMYNPPKELKFYCPPSGSGNKKQGEASDRLAVLLNGIAGNAGLFCDAENLAVFIQMILQDGSYGNMKIMKPSTIKTWTKLQPGQSFRALGWDIYTRGIYADNPDSAGDIFGLTSIDGKHILVDKNKNLFVILLSNSSRLNNQENNFINFANRLDKAVAQAILN